MASFRVWTVLLLDFDKCRARIAVSSAGDDLPCCVLLVVAFCG